MMDVSSRHPLKVEFQIVLLVTKGKLSFNFFNVSGVTEIINHVQKRFS